jgi:hypothetical protein
MLELGYPHLEAHKAHLELWFSEHFQALDAPLHEFAGAAGERQGRA